jgi:23S rRNA (uracil1939-C5)-methyltransferase
MDRVREELARDKVPYAKVEPPCPYFGTCGGCALQDLAYDDQLALKRQRLARALAGVKEAPPCELIGLDDPWRYRNKIELTFSQADGHLTLGYHAARSFWRVINLNDCLLAPAEMAPVLCSVRSLADRTGLPAYHPRTHRGFFRYLVLRHSQATGRLLVCVITTPGHQEAIEALVRELTASHPEIVSVYWGTTARIADVAWPESLMLLHGLPHLEDRVGPFRLEVHPLSFLQPTGVQAHRMYTHVCQALGEQPGGIAWDLYCGVGLAGLYLARSVQRVYGIDLEPRHVELAQRHAELNEIHNVEFRAGRVETLLMDRRFWLQEAKPDVIVVDPPRAGLHPRALTSLLAARPKTLAYLSCNVQSLIRDLQALGAGFPRYHLRELRAFDMFPQTPHVEVLAVLDRG